LIVFCQSSRRLIFNTLLSFITPVQSGNGCSSAYLMLLSKTVYVCSSACARLRNNI
jgi:hypothetical protein